jgi:predicted DNA-binding transcriptional regulator AlpA
VLATPPPRQAKAETPAVVHLGENTAIVIPEVRFGADWGFKATRPPVKETALPTIAEALKHFEHLPPDAVVRLPIVATLYGVSAPTVWRWSKAGRLPAPIKRGGVTAWRVGDLRAAMARAA